MFGMEACPNRSYTILKRPVTDRVGMVFHADYADGRGQRLSQKVALCPFSVHHYEGRMKLVADA